MAKEEAVSETPENEAATGRLSKKKKIIIVAVLLLLIAGGAAGAWFGGFIGPKQTAADGEASTEHAEEEAQKDEHGNPIPKAGPVYYSLPEFLVNLASNGKQTSFLKMQIALELPSQNDVAVIETNMPRIQDTFNTYLRELRPSDLSGSAGMSRLKQELLLRMNATVAPNKVNDILIKEILVQ